MAHLADGSAVCSSGGTVVHAAVTTAASSDTTSDFLPLTVDYRSRAYAFLVEFLQSLTAEKGMEVMMKCLYLASSTGLCALCFQRA